MYLALGAFLLSAFCFLLSLAGGFGVALVWLWGAYPLAIRWLWGGFDVALMSH
jgi:hypothetical protein